jgi:hypothetical protein
LDVLLVAVVLLGGAISHIVIRSFLLASAIATVACMMVAAIYFATAGQTTGGTPLVGVAIITISVACFLAVSVVGALVRRLRVRLKGSGKDQTSG